MNFAHDKIQTAAYRLIPSNQLTSLHCTIAAQLLHSYDDEAEAEEYALDIVSHVNSGFLDQLEGGVPQQNRSPQQQELARRITPSQSPDLSSKATDGVDGGDESSETKQSVGPVTASRDDGGCSDVPECWRDFFADIDVLDRVAELEIVAAKQAKSAGAYDSAIKLYTCALKLLRYRQQRKRDQDEDAAPSVNEDATAGSSCTSSAAVSAPPAAAASEVDDGNGTGIASAEFLVVSDEVWAESYASCLRIYQDLAQCLFLASAYQQCQLCVEYVLDHASNVQERSAQFELHVAVLSQQTRMQEALDTGLAHLKELGVELMPAMTPELEQWIFDVPDVTDERTFKEHKLFQLEEMPNPIVMTLLTSVCPPLFFLRSPLFYNVIITCLQLTKERGLTPELAYALGCYGLILWSTHKHYSEIYALGRCAKMLLENYGEAGRAILPRTNTPVLGGIYHWKLHLRECSRLLESAFEEALQQGDLEWGGYIGMYAEDTLVTCNWPVPIALAKHRAIQHTLIKKKCTMAFDYSCSWMAWHTFISTPVVPPVPEHRTAAPCSIAIVEAQACISRGMIAYYAHGFTAAVEELEAATGPMEGIPSLPLNSPYVFYYAMALLASIPVGNLCRTTGVTVVSTLPDGYDAASVDAKLARVDKFIAQMEIWSVPAPANYLHKLLLMQAERARVSIFSHHKALDQMFAAMDLYERAADGALANAYGLEHALALELAAKFYAACGRSAQARDLRQRCFEAYADHGALMKLVQLRQDYPADVFDPAIDHRRTVSQLNEQRNNAAHNATGSATGGGGMGAGALGQRGSGSAPGPSLISPSDAHAHGIGGVGVPPSSMSSSSSSSHTGQVSTSTSTSSASSSASIGLAPGSGGGAGVLTRITSAPGAGMGGGSMLGLGGVEEEGGIAPASIAAAAAAAHVLSSPNEILAASAAVRRHHSSSGGGVVDGVFPPSSSSGLGGRGMGGQGGAAISNSLSGAGGNGDGGMGNSSTTAADLDAVSVLKATASFSTEKNQRRLLKRLMAIVLETAGATRGVLVLHDAAKGGWNVELGGSVEMMDEVDSRKANNNSGGHDHKQGRRQAGEVGDANQGNEYAGNNDDESDNDGDTQSDAQSHSQSQSQSQSQQVPSSTPPTHPIILFNGRDVTSAAAQLDLPPPSFVSTNPEADGVGGADDAAAPVTRKASPDSNLDNVSSATDSTDGQHSLTSRLRMTGTATGSRAGDDGNGGGDGVGGHGGGYDTTGADTDNDGRVRLESTLPVSVFQYSIQSGGETVVLSEPRDLHAFSPFGADPYFLHHRPKACLCMPVLKAGQVFGVLYLENDFNDAAFTSSHIQLLQLLCGQAALSIDNARLYSQLSSTNADLQQLLVQRTSELAAVQAAMAQAEAAMKIKSEFLANSTFGPEHHCTAYAAPREHAASCC
jgi:GAF domain-containing protein